MLFAGFDIGSACIHSAAIDKDGTIIRVFPSLTHFGDPFRRLKQAARTIEMAFPERAVRSTSFTGSGAASISHAFPELFYEQDSVCLAMGACVLAPDCKLLMHLGARDSYFFSLMPGSRQAGPAIIDWATNTKCGGGSGTLVEKQVRRLMGKGFGEKDTDPDIKQRQIEQWFRIAIEEAALYPDARPYNARCGVVVQSDLIHDQNEGAPRPVILARLFATAAANYSQDVLASKEIETGSPCIMGGGLASCAPIQSAIGQLTGTTPLYFPESRSIGAIGVAAMAAARKDNNILDPERLDEARSEARKQRRYAPGLAKSLGSVTMIRERSPRDNSDPDSIVIGVDGGSTTTKAVVIDMVSGNLLDGRYRSTHGDPLGALKAVFREFEPRWRNSRIAGVCTTGSARKLFEKMLVRSSLKQSLSARGLAVLDTAIDEITCHAIGARHFDPLVDTILEIGGQDMKFTTFRKTDGRSTGQVEEARMNYSCQAGAGQTLENMAALLGLDVADSLQKEALSASMVPIIDSTCGVFMEIEQNRLQAEGHDRSQIAAAIVRATAASYFNKFVGGSGHLGDRCSCQGGPSLGAAFLAAMAQVTEREIVAFPHRELLGALGAALWLRDSILARRAQGLQTMSAFRGWEAIQSNPGCREVMCREHFKERSCGVRNCKLTLFEMDDETIVSGGFCPVGNSKGADAARTDYVRLFHLMLEKHFRGSLLESMDPPTKNTGPVIGIRRCGLMLGEKAVWASALFEYLGFTPVLSPVSDDRITRAGVESASPELCIAMKLSAGHAAIMLENPEIQLLFTPAYIEIDRNKSPNHTFCIYSEAEGFVLEDALGIDRAKLVRPVLHPGDENAMTETIAAELRRVGHPRSRERIRNALAGAARAEQAFSAALASTGRAFLDELSETGEKGYVGLGRDYVVLDPEASSRTGSMFSSVRGMRYLPQIFLREHYSGIDIDSLVENEYWAQSADILKACLFVARDPLLFPIRQMNFACGPDSIKWFMEEDIFKRAGKPLLHLMTDAQTNNAPFVTRAEAHERVVDQTPPGPSLPLEAFSYRRKRPLTHNGERLWLIPFMGEASRLGAAAGRFRGIDARVAPTATPEAREIADRFLSTETCFPLRGVTGDIAAHLLTMERERGSAFVNSRCLVFMPTTSGPCRFGKYAEIMGLLLDRLGFGEVPVISPTTTNGYLDTDALDIPGTFLKKASLLGDVYNAVYASGVLDDLTLRFRPYSDEKVFDEAHAMQLRSIENILETRGGSFRNIAPWISETAECFRSLSRETERYPLVLYSGEIYMRHHDPYTGWVIRALERQGLELVRNPVAEWLRYVNCMGGKDSSLLGYMAARTYMDRVDRKADRALGGVIADRRVLPHPEQLVAALQAEGVYHGDIRGESALSIGIFNEFLKGRLGAPGGPPLCGMFHIGPFTCMQEGVATARIRGLIKNRRRERPDLLAPVLHAFFGDSPNPNLEAEVAAFRQQCYLVREQAREHRSAV